MPWVKREIEMQLGTKLDGTSPPFCECDWRGLFGGVLLHLQIINGSNTPPSRHPQCLSPRGKTNSQGAPMCQTTRPTTMKELSEGSRGSRVEVLEVQEVQEVTLRLLMWYCSSSLPPQGEKQAICHQNEVKGGTESCESLCWKQKYFSRRRECSHLQEHLIVFTLQLTCLQQDQKCIICL